MPSPRKNQKPLPPAEWDFSSVTGEQLPFALTWEYARESDKIRTRILKWLDSTNSRGQTVRETKAKKFNQPNRAIDPEEHLKFPPFLRAGEIALEHENSQLSIPPFDWGFAHDTLRHLPPRYHLRQHAVLWELLSFYGHEFPKPWTEFYAANQERFFTHLRSYPVWWEPANFLLRHYNRKETVEHFEQILEQLRLSETSEQLKGLWNFAWQMIRNLGSMAKLEDVLDRAWLLQVDLAKTPKAKFLSEMERFWDQQQEILRDKLRKPRKVRGQAGRPPWSELTWLAASRLRKTLSIARSEAVVKLYQNRDNTNCTAAKRLGVANLVPTRKRRPLNQGGEFAFPQYSKPQSWTESVQKFRKKLKAFEQEILPYFT
jgi:hypothetical protein